MTMNRRIALLVLSFVSGYHAMFKRVRGADQAEFDPIATGKLRAGEILRKIAGSGRDTSRREPAYDELFYTGLLLQAGLRALLPVSERQGVALPGTPSPDEPKELIRAQQNYEIVFRSGVEATPEQYTVAIASIESAAQQLQDAGFVSLAGKVTEWLRTHR
jgi:hypothetical protein